MECSSTSVEDFQDYYNNRTAVGDADGIIHTSSLATKDDLTAPSPPSVEDDTASFSDSAHGHSSGADDEAVFDPPISRSSSPGTSHQSSDEDSLLLGGTHTSSRQASGIPCTPSKTRSPFHHPSSVRAMQLDTTPPHLTTPSSQRKRLYTPTRQSSTPRSARSGHRSTQSKLMNSSPVKTVKKEHPLVLLHITLLPLPHQYTLEILERVLPQSVFENWKLILERTTPTVLHRGVLIPHPREDYDLLEERLLESLELKQPRILKCGHFHLSPEEGVDIESSEDEDAESLVDADICADCGRRIRDGSHGDTGAGSKRWDVKVFAANGLMRSGAWSAAWREMERVDVEIIPWMEERLRRELDFQSEEHIRLRQEEEMARKEEGIAGLDDERLREIYGQNASLRGTPAKGRVQDEVDGLVDGTPAFKHDDTANEMPRSPSQSPFKFDTPHPHDGNHEMPLWDLLRNYLYLAAQDPRNLAIWALSAIVLLLSIGYVSTSTQAAHPALTPLGSHSQVIPTLSTLPAAGSTLVGNVADAVTNGGSSIISAAATAVGTMAGLRGATPSSVSKLSSMQTDAEKNSVTEGAAAEQEVEEEEDEARSWLAAAEDVVSGFVDEEPSFSDEG